jgi:diguanylate cyclase (GGDEF)-like protein
MSSEMMKHAPAAMRASRYAGELSKGAAEMRFPPDLEQEYRRFYLTERRVHVRSFNVIMLVLIVLGAGYAFFVRSFRPDLAQGLSLAAIALAYLAMVGVAYSRHYERFYLQTATRASLVVSLGAAICVAWSIRNGSGELFGLLTAYSIGVYFLAGILYHGALQANSAMLVAFAGTLAYLGESPARVVELTAILATSAAISGLAFRHQGIRFRRSFLERGLVGEMAVRDHLTGLTNRRGFDEHLTRTWQQALRDRRPLAVMMCDVDHFKRFNDRYGHQAGDEVLQRIGGVLDRFARRPLDLAARYGGEEFALTLFDVSREHAALLAEKLRRAAEQLQIPHADTRFGVVTISVGVAIIRPALERSPQGAVQLADEALYAAKRDGRNRVHVFESEYQELSTGTFRIP